MSHYFWDHRKQQQVFDQLPTTLKFVLVSLLISLINNSREGGWVHEYLSNKPPRDGTRSSKNKKWLYIIRNISFSAYSRNIHWQSVEWRKAKRKASQFYLLRRLNWRMSGYHVISWRLPTDLSRNQAINWISPSDLGRHADTRRDFGIMNTTTVITLLIVAHLIQGLLGEYIRECTHKRERVRTKNKANIWPVDLFNN